MNKKEVLEIRKQFTPENCAISRICGCYVDHEKEKKLELKKAFLSLPEEEAFKYYDIFKQTLSGTIGKNLINLEFPLEQEMPGGTIPCLLVVGASQIHGRSLSAARPREHPTSPAITKKERKKMQRAAFSAIAGELCRPTFCT